MPKKTAIFKAEYPYNCMLCGKEHPAGTRSLFEGSKLLAADCKWPQRINQKSNTDSIPQNGKEGSPGSPKVTLLQQPSSYDIDKEFLKSKKFIEENFGNVDYSIGTLIEEHEREKFSLWMSRQIQQNKKENIKAIR